MKKHRQLLALFICLVMSVSLLTGYSETKAATEEPTQSAEQDATQETAETREITDMAGRKVLSQQQKILNLFFQRVR